GAIFTRGSCDVYSPKVIRAAAGAVLRLPIIANADPCEILDALKDRATKIFAAHPRGDFLPYDLNMRDNFCLLVGNESHGVSDAALARADATVRLPMTNSTESLNASVAGSILLYEAVRQACDGRR
ncbi:MAG: RNA methyltransferase, partial [Defluviitaleaceae bacterium]|nr:RNA methyltransferase [Defluviitaleaceae bacterium]